MQKKKHKDNQTSKKLRYYKYLLILPIIFLFLIGIEIYIQTRSVTKAQESITEINTQLTKLVNTQNPKVALETLNGILSDDRIANACHSLTHDIGHAAYLKYNNISQALVYNDEICGSGYIHGLIEELFSQAKNIDQINQELLTVCAPQNLGICFHGIGHGFMYFSSNNLSFSLSNCDDLTIDYKVHNCYDGVFMENFEGDHIDHPTNFLDSTTPESTCQNLGPKYKESCYFYDVRYYLQLHPREYLNTFAWCRTFKDGYRLACIKGVGSALMKQNLNEPDFVESMCSKTLNSQEKEYCINGMVSYYLTNFYSIDAGIRMCNSLTSTGRKQCLNYVTEEQMNFPN